MEKSWVDLEGQRLKIQPGGPLRALLEGRAGSRPDADNPVALAVVNGRRTGLDEPLWGGERILTLRLNDPEVHSTIVRTLCSLLAAVCAEIFPRHPLVIDFGYSGGMYCKLRRDEPLGEGELNTIETRMRELIRDDLPLKPQVYSEQQLTHLPEASLSGATGILSIGAGQRPLYRIGDGRLLFSGLHLPSTGFLRAFALVREEPGLVILPCLPGEPGAVTPYRPQPKLLAAMCEYSAWTEQQGLADLGSINRLVMEGRTRDLIQISEARHDRFVVQAAERVAALPESGRLVLVAGPSSSGKTTFAKRLELQLRVLGLSPFALSLDDYFVDRDQTPRDANGDFDFEDLSALHLDLFNRHLEGLLAGEEVRLRRFDFTTGRGGENGGPTRLERGAPLIVEGIHALNPALGAGVDEARKLRIYVSALCHTNIDDTTYIPTSLLRLYRRIVRDAQFRGYTAAQTLSRWASVRAGEEKHIFPFQQNAELFFNSGLVYELGVLKLWAEPRLAAVPPSDPTFGPARTLLAVLGTHLPIDAGMVPPTSLLREFIGKSGFHY